MLIEGRIVGQDTGRIVVNVDTVFNSFDNNAIFCIGEDPVEFGRRKLGAEGGIDEVHFFKESASFGNGAALAKDPRDEFELCNVGFAVDSGMEDGVANEIEAGHAETFFVDCIVKEGKIVAVWVGSDVSDAEQGKM